MVLTSPVHTSPGGLQPGSKTLPVGLQSPDFDDDEVSYPCRLSVSEPFNFDAAPAPAPAPALAPT